MEAHPPGWGIAGQDAGKVVIDAVMGGAALFDPETRIRSPGSSRGSRGLPFSAGAHPMYRSTPRALRLPPLQITGDKRSAAKFSVQPYLPC